MLPFCQALLLAFLAEFLQQCGAVLVRSESLAATASLPRALSSAAWVPFPGPHWPDALVARVINLPSRPDRWAQMQADWAHIRSVRLARMDATSHYPHPSNNSITVNGFSHSHIQAVEEAFASDAQAQVALVLEDDALPRPTFDSVFPRILSYALSHLEDWDIINLGPSRVLPDKDPAANDSRVPVFQLRSPDLLRVSVWSATQAVLINRRLLPRYAQMKQSFMQHDRRVPQSFADHVLSRDPTVVTLVPVPMLVVQQPGYSDLLGIETSYLDYHDQAEATLWDMKGLLKENSDWPAMQLLTEAEEQQWLRWEQQQWREQQDRQEDRDVVAQHFAEGSAHHAEPSGDGVGRSTSPSANSVAEERGGGTEEEHFTVASQAQRYIKGRRFDDWG